MRLLTRLFGAFFILAVIVVAAFSRTTFVAGSAPNRAPAVQGFASCAFDRPARFIDCTGRAVLTLIGQNNQSVSVYGPFTVQFSGDLCRTTTAGTLFVCLATARLVVSSPGGEHFFAYAPFTAQFGVDQ